MPEVTATVTDTLGLSASATAAYTISGTAAPLRGWQLTASNTGLAGAGVDKTTLPAYTGGLYVPANTTITLKRIDTELVLSQPGIVLDRCWIRPTNANRSPGMPLASSVDFDSTFAPKLPAPILKDCDIDGSLILNDTRLGASSNSAWEGLVSMYRCHIYGMGSGIVIRNTGLAGDGIVEGCYAHGFRAWGDPDADGSHNEAATVRDFGSVNPRTLVFRNNRFACDTPLNGSGAMFNQGSGNDYGQPSAMANVTLDGNLFEGGPYNLVVAGQPDYPMGYSNWRARDNRFFGWTYGPVSTATGPGWTEWADNHVYDSAQADAKGAVVNP